MKNRDTRDTEIYYPKEIGLEKAIKLFDVLEGKIRRIYTPNDVYVKHINPNGIQIIKSIV